ncbi:hypothetical protein K9O30_12705 [Clostridium bowmanii]|uniref:hypothetical protein n=1 Tax=Clostridium bowmanii TaxID=132925 RepID=UPI001C0ADCB2|nr:hypothetical protein [Clostridium bowmanii]MBU3189998.1 hypothetical protein [Clostridium bowmanii]MCA1074567.1 hypothetical protein [Clostridium bowmanii]
MKKMYKIGIGIILICVIAIGIYYTFPKRINVTLNGVSYKNNNKQQQEQVIIKIDGSYGKRILKKDLFVGAITIGNLRCDGVEISVGDNSSFLTYIDKNKEPGKIYYGEMFTNNKLTKLTISVFGENVTMISAPAKDRVEAVKISNELMKNVLEENFKFK